MIKSSVAIIVAALSTSAICPAQAQEASAKTVLPETPANTLEDWRFASAMKAEGYMPIPLASKANHYFIDVVIGQDKGRFLMDSGAMASVLYETSAARFKMEMESANLDAVGVGGGGKINSIAKTKALACGTLSGLKQSFYVTHSAVKPEAGDGYWDGLLGADFLQAHAGVIDFSSHTVWLRSAPGKPAATSRFNASMNSLGYAAAKFTVQEGHLFVDASIGDVKARLLLDSGAVVSMFKKSATEKYTMTLIIGRAVIAGLSGPEEVKALAKTQQLRIGAGDAGAQDFYVVELAGLPQDFLGRFDGILGCDFFATKKALIDYANSTLWLPQSKGSK